MKSMRSIAFGLAVVALAVSCVSSAVASGLYRLKVWAVDLLSAKAEPEAAAQAVPLVQRVRHFAYQLRQIKRHRPVVTPRWRMCPSG